MASSNQPQSLEAMLGGITEVTGTCERHGQWESKTFTHMISRARCPSCVNEEKQAAAEAEVAKKTEADRVRRLKNLADRGVSARHIGKTFDTYIADTREQEYALNSCKDLALSVIAGKERIPSLILSGGPGTGKTHLTCAIIQACYDAGKDAIKSNIMEIIRDIKSTWRKGSEAGEEDVITWYADRDLLVIDEIGVQFGSDTERMYVFEIINRRYEACLPTVLVTNLDVAGLRQEVGERVLDRLREDGGRMLVFTGKSWRAQ